MYKLVISEAAEYDLLSIYDYTFEYFGETKWIEYNSEIQNNIEKIINNPSIGHSRKDIPENCLAWPVNNHFIIYRVVENYIQIARILHQKLNFLNQF